MDNADYWLMAREYSIWNAAIVHYSFGQKTSIQSPWVELQNVFTPHFSIHLPVTHCASNLMKHCLDILSWHLMQLLTSKYCQLMKVIRVVSIPLTYPLHYGRLFTFTTFPAWNILHSTQFSPHLTVHHKLHPDQCTDTYLLAQQTNTP